MLAAKSTILNVKICVFSLNILVLLPVCYILMFRNKKRGQGGLFMLLYIIVLQGLEQATGGYRREARNYIVVYVII